MILLDSVGNLALPERLVESLAESEVALALGALDELLDLPGAGAGGLIGLLAVLLLLLHGLLLLLGGLVAAAGSGEHSGHGVAHGVADGGADGDASCGGGHLECSKSGGCG